MSKVFRLVSIQIGAVLTDMLSIGNSRNKKSKATGYGGLALFIVLMSGVSLMYCSMIASGLKMFNSLELLPVLVMAATSLVSLVTTIFKVKGTIFGFRDYDMVMSLPVSTAGMVASRVILLYAVNMVFTAIIMIPAMLVYGAVAKPGVIYVLISIITLFFIPLVPIVLASVLGTIVAYAASRFRYTNLFHILFSIVMFLGYLFLSMNMGDAGQEFADMSRALTEQVNSTYPLAPLYSKAVIHYDIVAMLMFIGISLLAFLLYTLVIGKCFKWLNSKMLTGSTRTKFKMGELKARSPFFAVYWKEMKRFFSTPIYVLNTGFGVILLTLGALALLFVTSPLADLLNLHFKIEEILSMPQFSGMLGSFGPLFVSFFIMMSSTTMASISLEGKNLWILKSLPVSTKTIFHAKIAVNLAILSPILLDIVIIGFVLNYDLIQGLIIILTTIVCSIFVSVYGLLVNLKFPNFDWTTETTVVKQSAAALVCVLTGMGIVGLQYLLIYLIPNTSLAYFIYIGLMAIVDCILYHKLMVYGTSRFREF
ncbi:MAG: hypothetical protein GX359_02510 [Clostridiales bacterium]|nr:hypothetical protein [Clostridiales bacterium]